MAFFSLNFSSGIVIVAMVMLVCNTIVDKNLLYDLTSNSFKLTHKDYFQAKIMVLIFLYVHGTSLRHT